MMITLTPWAIKASTLALFLGGITLAEQDLDVVPGGFEGILETGFVLDPARLILGRKNDTNSQLANVSKPVEVGGRPVTGVDHGGLDIALVNRDYHRRFGRYIDLAVVVGCGLLGGIALQDRQLQQ